MDANRFQVKSYMASLWTSDTQSNPTLARGTTSAPGAFAVQGIHSQEYLQELQAANGSGPLRPATSSPLPGTGVSGSPLPGTGVASSPLPGTGVVTASCHYGYEDEPNEENLEQEGMPHAVEAQLAPDEGEVAARMAEHLERRMTQVLKEEVRQALEETNDTPSETTSSVLKTRRRSSYDDISICGVPRRTWGFCMLLLLAVAGAGIAGGLWYLRSTNNGAPSMPTPTPTARPTLATEAPTPAFQNPDMLKEQLLPYIVRNDEDLLRLQNPTTAQYKALAWLSEDGSAAFYGDNERGAASTTSDDLYEGVPTEVWLERYVLAVLYFSTAGPNWRIDLYFLDHTRSVCDWNSGAGLRDETSRGVYCENGIPLPSSTNNNVLGELSVTNMNLRETGLTGLLPWEITLLEVLRMLDLDGNFLLGSLPPGMAFLTELETLWVKSNSLTGELPIDLPSSLQSLDLSDNAISGILPTEWGETLPALNFLSVSLNGLQGSLPGSWQSLSFLESLDLEGNQLTGTIPVGYGSWKNTEKLFLEFNQLTGSLPTELGLLTSLRQFLVHDNLFTGTVPTEFARLANLDFFWFHANDLTGSVDGIFCAEGGTTPEFLRGNCLASPTPEIECSCCSACCLPDGTGCERP